MNKLAFLLLVAAMPCVFSQSLKTEELNVYMTRSNWLFASDVADLAHVDFANLRAIEIEDGQWQELRKGRGKSATSIGDGLHQFTEVWLTWVYQLDAQHSVVDYEWEWVVGSSSHSNVVQVFELRDRKVYITQQIEADIHHGGDAVGAWFNADKKLLTVKAVADSPQGRCCPTEMNVLILRWEGNKFRRISAKTVPLPKEN